MFQLAQQFGMPVRQLLHQISHLEFSYWMAKQSFDPIGEERADLRAGIVASAATNVHLKKKDRVTAVDFMPYRDAKKPRDWEAELMGDLKRRAKPAE